MEQGITRNQMVNQLIRIGHGDFSVYTKLGLQAVKDEPELFGHLISWNSIKGEVRDSKVALPVIALRGEKDAELYENAAANLCLLDPRNLLRACYYNKELGPANGGGKWLKDAVVRYVKAREKSRKWWDRTALQHRSSLKGLYALNHIKPTPRAQRILFKRDYPQGSVFAKLKELKNMAPDEAAGFILINRIPFLVAVGALGGIKGKPDIVLALIERMSGAELISNTKMLERMGVFESPALKVAYDKAIERMKKDKKVSSLKAGKAAKHVDGKAAKQLEKIQEERLASLGGLEGDWLVLGDRSGSMDESVEAARQIASLIAKQVRGSVHLVFFNTSPMYFNVTGKTLNEITDETRRLRATGGTSIGCGLDLISEKNIVVNGIAIASDGGDNTAPYFHGAYRRYADKFGTEPTVYLYHLPGEWNALTPYCQRDGILLEQFELGSRPDYYALPNLVATMRTGRYTLVEEIMDCPLLTFKEVFKEAV